MAALACFTREPCTGAALRTTAAAVPAWRVISILVPIACRSATDARQGMRTRSAAWAAARATSVECGAVSIMASLAPASRAAVSRVGSWAACPEMTAGVSEMRRLAHAEAEPCGSRSTSAVTSPSCSLATAKLLCGNIGAFVFVADGFDFLTSVLFLSHARLPLLALRAAVSESLG